MRNDGLPSIINENTLVPKLTFLERDVGEVQNPDSKGSNPVGAGRLKSAFFEHKSNLSQAGTAAPTSRQIELWLAGDPIELTDLGFFHYFFWNRYQKRYDSFEPHQKKVFHQIRRFFRFYEGKYVGDDNTKRTSRKSKTSTTGVSATRLLDVQIVLNGLIDHLDDKRALLENERPNSPESVEIQSKSLELIQFLDERVEKVRLEIDQAIDEANNDISEAQVELLEQIGEEFKRWIKENNPEIVDAVMRLTPAASFIGIMSLAGANMLWATPVVLALCGGKKIVDIVKGISS